MKKPNRANLIRILSIFISIMVLTTLSSCLDPVEIVRPERVRGTFGTELYNILYDNTITSPDDGKARAATFEQNRQAFIAAVDDTAPEENLDELNNVFKDIVPLYENFLYPATLRKVARLLGMVSESEEVTGALSYIDNKPQLVESPEQEYMLAYVYEYPELPKLLRVFLDLLLENASETGNVGHTYNATNQFIKELSIGMEKMKPWESKDSLLYSVIDRLTDMDKDFKPDLAIWNPATAVKVSWNGAPRLNPLAGDGVFVPFVDNDKDGQPDTDAFGRFVLFDGSTTSPFDPNVASSPYFELNNKLQVTKNGVPVYEYIDLYQTPLAYLLREGDTLFIDSTLDDLLRATKTILGDSTLYTDERGSYEGYTKDSPVIQLVQGGLLALDHDDLDANLEALITLLEEHPDTISALLYDVSKILDMIDELDPEMNLDNNLLDVVLPILLELAETPGLLEDLMVALNKPVSKHLGPGLAELAKIKKDFITVDPDSAYNVCFQKCNTGFELGTESRYSCIRQCPYQDVIGTTPVDRSKPESVENRSIFERICALMWETSEANYEVYVEKLVVKGLDLSVIAKGLGQILTMNNLAALYLSTLTGEMKLSNHVHENVIKLGEMLNMSADDVVSLFLLIAKGFFDVDLSPSPTTSEVTRFFNKTRIYSKSDDYELELTLARCNSGHECVYSHADALYAIESTGLVDALYPVVSVFNAYGQTAQLARLVAEIYRHYPSGAVQYTDAKGNPLDYEYDNLRSIEPVLTRALDETQILESLGAFSDVYTNIQLSDGTKLMDRFSSYVSYLLKPDPGIRNLKGQTSTTDPNGKVISPLSPAYLIIDPIREIADRSDAHPDFSKQLKNGLSGLASVTIKTVKGKNGKVQFEKPAGIKIAAKALQIILDLYRSETEKKTRSEWLRTTALNDVQSFISGRLPYAFFILFDDLDRNPEGLEMIRKFVLYLMQSGKEVSPHATIMLYDLGSLVLEQKHLIDVAHFFAAPMDPDFDWQAEWYKEYSLVTTLLKCVSSFIEYDSNNIFNTTFYRLFNTKGKRHSNFYKIIDIGKAVLRRPSGSSELYTARDYQNFFEFAYDLFTDDERGVERIFKTIEFTVWGSAGRPYTNEYEMEEYWPPERLETWPPQPQISKKE